MALKIKVGVFFGGKSVEHEVSVISGLLAYRNLHPETYEPVAIYISKQGEMYVGEKIAQIESYKGDIKALTAESTRVTLINDGGKIRLIRYPAKRFGSNIMDTIDVALPVVHGTNVEDGNLAGFLHSLSCPYVGCDVLSAALGMDKYLTKLLASAAGVKIAQGEKTTAAAYLQNGTKVPYPYVVKPVCDGSSVGVYIVHNAEEAKNVTYTDSNLPLLIEQYIAGRELTAMCLNGKSNVITELKTDCSFYDYQAKYTSGKTHHILLCYSNIKRPLWKHFHKAPIS